MQESWGAEILDNAKQFNTLFSLYSVCTTKNIDRALPAVGGEIRCHTPCSSRSQLGVGGLSLLGVLGQSAGDPLSDQSKGKESLALPHPGDWAPGCRG